MGKVSVFRLAVLTIMLVIIVFVSHLASGKSQIAGKEPLNRVLETLPGWKATESHSMGAAIEEALDLDDYLLRSYQRGQDRVALYIGYYRRVEKIGAAHDPLVCFTGQGWQLTQRGTGTHRLAGPSALTINYSSMVAERQTDKELIIYWFQTNGATSSGTLGQKVAMALDRLRRAPEENAFVRLSTTLGNEPTEAARRRIFDFIETFYPIFHGYVVGT